MWPLPGLEPSCLAAGAQPGISVLGMLLQYRGWACNADIHMDTDLATAVAGHRASDWPWQPPNSGLTPDMGTQRHISSSSRAVRGRKSQIQHTHHTLRFTNTHLHSSLSDQHSPSGCPAPLPRCLSPLPTPQVPRSPAGLTGCSLPTCSSHTLVPLPGHTHGSPPNTSTALLPARYPTHTWGLLLLGFWVCQWIHTNTPCTAVLGKVHGLSPRSLHHKMVQMQHWAPHWLFTEFFVTTRVETGSLLSEESPTCLDYAHVYLLPCATKSSFEFFLAKDRIKLFLSNEVCSWYNTGSNDNM